MERGNGDHQGQRGPKREAARYRKNGHRKLSVRFIEPR
ncbi:hypothetical protein NH44784_040841 [Achromobacter xylosoxidans NH44784-1996]|nr:hypothetical protein NH44784_040841 [Achromobacter xylosoxidans NH44784-1996]